MVNTNSEHQKDKNLYGQYRIIGLIALILLIFGILAGGYIGLTLYLIGFILALIWTINRFRMGKRGILQWIVLAMILLALYGFIAGILRTASLIK